MTLLEALIAMAVAALMIVGVLEASHLAAQRTLIARMDLEAILKAQMLLATADTRNSANASRLDGHDARGVTWTMFLRRDPLTSGSNTVDVTARVKIARGGQYVEHTLSTLKITSEVAQ